MFSLGTELSLDLFPSATWTASEPVGSADADYPGLRPSGSWLLRPDGWLHCIDPVGSGWRDRATGEQVELSGRRLVLAYGSNPDPNKLLDRAGFFGHEVVFALRAAIFGWAAVWCDARRQRDGAVVATLAAAPGRMEIHPLLALTPHQLAEMDRWEGHPTFYYRTAHQGQVWLESGHWAENVNVYLGTEKKRPILTGESGQPLLCADVPHSEVDLMVTS